MCIQVNYAYGVEEFYLFTIFLQSMFDGSQHWLHFICDTLPWPETLHPAAKGDEDEHYFIVIDLLRLCHR